MKPGSLRGRHDQEKRRSGTLRHPESKAARSPAGKPNPIHSSWVRRHDRKHKAKATGLVSKKCKSLSKKKQDQIALSFVTSQTGDQWAVDAAKARHPST